MVTMKGPPTTAVRRRIRCISNSNDIYSLYRFHKSYAVMLDDMTKSASPIPANHMKKAIIGMTIMSLICFRLETDRVGWKNERSWMYRSALLNASASGIESTDPYTFCRKVVLDERARINVSHLKIRIREEGLKKVKCDEVVGNHVARQCLGEIDL